VQLKAEIETLKQSVQDMEAQKEDIQQQIDETNTELEGDSEISSQYLEYTKKNEELKSSIEELENQIDELDNQISDMKAELSETSSGTASGKTYALNKNESYTCPEKIPAGRYKATGSGVLRIYSESGKLKNSEDLDVAPGNSFTFTLEEKQKIAVTGEVTLSELK
jgi:predicted RNase H-like nuclease (RuvC/YqgF family)